MGATAPSLPKIGIVTVSDRASQGIYADESGPAIEAALRDYLATPCEYLVRVIADERDGIGTTLRELAASLRAGVPTAILSRQTAAILDRTLVVTLPGKPASIRVCLDAVFPAIPYCIDLIGGPRLDGNPAVVQVFRPKGK